MSEQESKSSWIYLVDQRGDRHPVLKLTKEEIGKIQEQIKTSADIDIPGKVYFSRMQIVGFSTMHAHHLGFCEFGLRRPPEFKEHK